MLSTFRALILVAGLASVAFPCSPVAADRILGSDLAGAEPRLASIPSSTVVGYAPLLGVKRVFSAAEVIRIARMHNIALNDASELCFEVPLKALSSSDLIGAMKRVLPEGTDIVITEWSKVGVPSGELQFPFSGLEPVDANGTQVWRGFVQYSGTRRSPVWARVELQQSIEAVVAARDLTANTVLDASSVRTKSWTGKFQREPVAVSATEVIGKVLGRPIKAGGPIPVASLVAPPAIRRGDSVRVEVHCGPARLALNAVAVRDGRKGESIELRNPATGKTFRARVQGAGAVLELEAGNVL